MDILEVLDGGLQTTVQDLGRNGYQRYGVPVSGALDPFALRVANRLAGNDERAAGLEMTIVGPRLRFLANTVIALTGANLSPLLDGEPAPMWEPCAVSVGSTLSFGEAVDGARAYLAIACGGIDVPLVLGSRSTHVRSKLGGVSGRAVQSGDRLQGPGDEPPRIVRARRLTTEPVPRYGSSHALRVVLGPQDTAFTAGGLDTLLSATYTVTNQSDRIGYRLQGPVIEHATSPDIVSDAVPNGAVQVAGDGMPIILLADRGTTGGYTKIATVISIDLPRVAQAQAGHTVRFTAVTIDEAHALLREQEEALRRLAAGAPVHFGRRRFRAAVDGIECEVESDLAELPEAPAPSRAPRLETAVRVAGDRAVRSFNVDVDEIG